MGKRKGVAIPFDDNWKRVMISAFNKSGLTRSSFGKKIDVNKGTVTKLLRDPSDKEDMKHPYRSSIAVPRICEVLHINPPGAARLGRYEQRWLACLEVFKKADQIAKLERFTKSMEDFAARIEKAQSARDKANQEEESAWSTLTESLPGNQISAKSSQK